MDNYLVIENIAIPLKLDERFIPPDLETALKYYPSFIKYAKIDWSIQAYLCYIMKQIDKQRPNGYDGDKAVQEFITYFGLWEFGKLLMDNKR